MQKDIKINQDWLQNRAAQLKKQKEESSRYITLKQGENILKIDLSILPEEITQQGADGKRYKKMVYTTCIMKDGKPMLLAASLALDSLIVKALCNGINPMTIIRVGENLQTRYAVKELAEPETTEPNTA